ncbi:MAG TPA: 50S ribosomal protein L32e [Candidatus Poseidoniales archaeon]|nr:50S ribosomal protein L32e [Candidatus Poseidoniales archaeon]
MSELSDLTVAQLKELLKEAGLPVSGKKADLVARLIESSDVDEVETSDSNEDWDEDGDWDDEVVVGHVAKQKPILDDATKAALSLRSEQKKKTPSFRRTEWFRYKRLSRSGWRAPHGMDSKQRRNYKYRSSLVRVGHGKVSTSRGLHSSGFREIMVQNTVDLETIDPETEAARVGRSVGGRKREHIYSRADELGIRVLNRRRDI